MKYEKAIVFIDNGYFFYVRKEELNDVKIEYELLSKKLCSIHNGDWYATYFYDCLPYIDENSTTEEREFYSKRQSFQDALKRKNRFVVREGNIRPVRVYNPKKKKQEIVDFEQKGVDVYFALDLLKLCYMDKIDMAILICGDSDFVPAIKEVRDLGIPVIIYHGHSFHDYLKQNCYEEHSINHELVKDCIIK